MSVTAQLSSSLNQRDEAANIALAKQIVTTSDAKGVAELISNLTKGTKDIQSDSIKALYEIGNLNPALIATYVKDFVNLLDSNNNRLQWGAMTAISSIAAAKANEVYDALPKLAAIADKGSVITKDNYVAILIKLSAIKKYSNDVLTLLREQMLHCPSNQLPMYAEQSLHIINEAHKAAFIKMYTERLDDFEKESKRKRLEKVIKKLSGG